jgi:hypothetical protein
MLDITEYQDKIYFAWKSERKAAKLLTMKIASTTTTYLFYRAKKNIPRGEGGGRTAVRVADLCPCPYAGVKYAPYFLSLWIA